MFNSRFNLREYLTHIGLPDYQPAPTLECLKKISFQHVVTFPYQNIRLHNEGKKPVQDRQPASLDPNVLFDEMVTNKGPAYCYQQMTLLHEALTQIGFNVSRHLSKVILQPRSQADLEAAAKLNDTHILMTVTIDGRDYIVDSGFANESLREPLPLSAGTHEPACDDYLLEEYSDYWLLNSKRYDSKGNGYWFTLFRFDKRAALEDAITHAHQELYFAENIPIRSNLLFSTVSYSKRKYVFWDAIVQKGTFLSVNIDGSKRDSKTFSSAEESVEFATKKFHLK
jgi:arylamine N-acetyltransferase